MTLTRHRTCHFFNTGTNKTLETSTALSNCMQAHTTDVCACRTKYGQYQFVADKCDGTINSTTDDLFQACDNGCESRTVQHCAVLLLTTVDFAPVLLRFYVSLCSPRHPVHNLYRQHRQGPALHVQELRRHVLPLR